MPELDDDLRKELREAFDQFDRDGNGTIDLNEFAELLDQIGADMNAEETTIGFAEIDQDANGQIDFAEFTAWWTDQ